MNINVYTESTPNPATMKFIVNKLLINGSVDYATKESAEKSPFAKEFVKGAVESELKVQLEEQEEVNFEGTDAEVKIQQILQDYVRPAVEQDGGAITYKSFNEGVVTVELRGSCSGCPSSTVTLKAGIENLL